MGGAYASGPVLTSGQDLGLELLTTKKADT